MEKSLVRSVRVAYTCYLHSFTLKKFFFFFFIRTSRGFFRAFRVCFSQVKTRFEHSICDKHARVSLSVDTRSTKCTPARRRKQRTVNSRLVHTLNVAITIPLQKRTFKSANFQTRQFPFLSNLIILARLRFY